MSDGMDEMQRRANEAAANWQGDPRDAEITRLTAENEALANDRDGYVQLLTDQNNALTAENERLRIALLTIAGHPELYNTKGYDIARAALTQPAIRTDSRYNNAERIFGDD